MTLASFCHSLPEYITISKLLHFLDAEQEIQLKVFCIVLIHYN